MQVAVESVVVVRAEVVTGEVRPAAEASVEGVQVVVAPAAVASAVAVSVVVVRVAAVRAAVAIESAVHSTFDELSVNRG